MREVLSGSLKLVAALFVLFLTHRAASFDALSGGRIVTSSDALRAFFVGGLSDLWVAVLCGSIFGLCSLPLTARDFARRAWVPLTAVLALLTVGHQGYVEFFKFQIIPAHLKYLLDPDFMSANSGAVLGFRGAVIAVAWASAAFVISRLDTSRFSLRTLATTASVVMILALLAHNRNIHLRVQWFVPEHLQTNGLERLYLNIKTLRSPEALTDTELLSLSELLQSKAPPAPSSLFDLLSVPSSDESGLHPLAPIIRANFVGRVRSGARPLALVVLLESLRPSETGYFTPSRPSLTPTLDRIHASGVSFSRAVSTGSVTRGAQEAAFCGYLGSRDTALMRSGSLRRFDCLPDLIHRTSTERPSGEVFWFHGGEGRFDGQLAFWASHGIARQMSLKDFPDDAPRTGWGVGDRTFFSRAARDVTELRKESKRDYLLGMLLSVTNHIPWTLPSDAFNAANSSEHEGHPSYLTTAYTDAALGEFLESLKANGTWKDSLVVIASDHGNNIPPRVDLYHGREDRDAWLQAHVNLLLTGGVVDDALHALAQSQLAFGHLVGQADIAAFLAYAMGVDSRLLGENLFRTTRRLPVLSDLEEGLFSPSAKRLYPRSATLTSPPQEATDDVKRELLYYRAFLQMISSTK